MPVIVIANPKGGAGKSTLSLVLGRPSHRKAQASHLLIVILIDRSWTGRRDRPPQQCVLLATRPRAR